MSGQKSSPVRRREVITCAIWVLSKRRFGPACAKGLLRAPWRRGQSKRMCSAARSFPQEHCSGGLLGNGSEVVEFVWSRNRARSEAGLSVRRFVGSGVICLIRRGGSGGCLRSSLQLANTVPWPEARLSRPGHDHVSDRAALSLTRTSASLLPGIPEWAEVQRPPIDQPSSNGCLTVSRVCRVNSVFVGLPIESVSHADWLSTQTRILEGGVWPPLCIAQRPS